MDIKPRDIRHPVPAYFGTSITSLGSSFTDEFSDVNVVNGLERANERLNCDQQRDMAQVRHQREIIEQQLVDYQKTRLQLESLEEEQLELKERLKELDRNLTVVWDEAQEATKKDELFSNAYKNLISQEDPTIKHVAQYLRNSIPIREELFETLYVTGRTEKYAVENALDLQVDYRRRLRKLFPIHTQLTLKHRELRRQYDRLQISKKTIYDELLATLDEMDQIDSLLSLYSLARISNSK
ncbi:hypothetical protein M3Y98_00199800 [Aphelenchoides besseyi]|nr:hypothetical protein M3Y98_00199800 [Aphelenchoides besseyi]KAI6200286.1 hypothetical protein M3Y96_00717500 [Aphelenchoides besseyi]